MEYQKLLARSEMSVCEEANARVLAEHELSEQYEAKVGMIIMEGIKKLKEGVPKLMEGVPKLKEGVHKLSETLKKII